MSFLYPYLAVASLALLLPLAIHLWNRQQSQPILFGTIKWLEEAQETKSSSIQFTDFWLFVLRCCLLGLFVFLLLKLFSEKEIQIKSSYHKTWLLVQPSSLAKVENILADFPKSQYQHRYFTEGFPTIDSLPIEVEDTQTPWQLLQSIDQMPLAPDTVVVLSKLSLSELKGDKKGISTFVKWQALPLEKPVSFLLSARKDKNNRIKVLLGHSQEKGQAIETFIFSYENQKKVKSPRGELISIHEGDTLQLSHEAYPEDKVSVLEDRPISIHIEHDPDFQKDVQYVKAALDAIASYAGISIDVNPKTEEIDWVVALKGKGTLPKNQGQRGSIIFDPNQKAKTNLISPKRGKPNTYSLNRRIAKAAVETQLVEELIVLLLSDSNWEKRLDQYDERLPDAEQYQLPYRATEQVEASDLTAKERHFFDFPIWLGLIGLFLLERIISIKRQN